MSDEMACPALGGVPCGADDCLTNGCVEQRPECCDGCGDPGARHWRGGGWYCEGCAACETCGSPYCEDPSHEW